MTDFLKEVVSDNVIDLSQKQYEEGSKICCLCNVKFKGHGNNPEPIKPLRKGKLTQLCCDQCNDRVIHERLTLVKSGYWR